MFSLLNNGKETRFFVDGINMVMRIFYTFILEYSFYSVTF